MSVGIPQKLTVRTQFAKTLSYITRIFPEIMSQHTFERVTKFMCIVQIRRTIDKNTKKF
jgi:hypothetical protein